MLRGPTFKDVDLAISRDFSLSRLREGMNLQFRADAYNVFNIVSLNNPTGNGATPLVVKSIQNVCTELKVECTLQTD